MVSVSRLIKRWLIITATMEASPKTQTQVGNHKYKALIRFEHTTHILSNVIKGGPEIEAVEKSCSDKKGKHAGEEQCIGIRKSKMTFRLIL